MFVKSDSPRRFLNSEDRKVEHLHQRFSISSLGDTKSSLALLELSEQLVA
jgi:hypothetical protein